MTLTFNPQLENSSLNAIRDAIDSGDGPGAIELYAGATLIASLELPKPSFSNESGGQSFLNSPAQGMAVAAGQPDSFKFVTSYGATVFTGAVPSDLVVDFTPSGAAIVASFTLEAGVVQEREFASTTTLPYQVPAPTNWGPMLQGLNSGTTTEQIYAIGYGSGAWVAGFDSGYAARSTDNGLTWSALPRGLSNRGAASNSIDCIATDGSGVWVVGMDNGFSSRSTDNGVTWTGLLRYAITAGQLSRAFGLATDRLGVWIAAGSSSRAARSIDNGLTWEALTVGLGTGTSNQVIYSVATDGNGVWVAVFSAGYAARSTDNGVTWAALPRYLAGAPSPNTDLRSVCYGGGVFVAVGDEGHAVRSTDLGATWQVLPQYLASGASGLSSSRSLSADRFGNWVAGFTTGHAAYSSDGALSWAPIVTGLNSGGTGSIESLTTNGAGVFMAGFSDGHAAISPPLGA